MWQLGLVWLWHNCLPLSDWGVYSQYEYCIHLTASDATKNKYYEYVYMVLYHKLLQASTVYKGLDKQHSHPGQYILENILQLAKALWRQLER